jgi:putative DNA primase/helicase
VTNISSLDLSDFDKRFKNAEVFGKLANIGDDIDDGYISSSAMFKKFVTGERVQVERKGKDPFEFESYAKLWFSANEIPKIKDRGGAVQRRLIIVPFLAHFSKDDPDYRPYIKYELVEPESIEYLIQLGIAGLKRVLENQCFTTSAKIQKQLDDFEENNNPIIAFFNENDELEIENQTTESIFQKYNGFCLSNNYVAVSKREFNKQVMRIFKVETKPCKVDGKTQRVFVSR